MQNKPDEIVEAIKIAFESAAYPGDNAITYDDVNNHLEASEIAQFFRGVTWQSVSFELILAHSDALFFMTPEAHQYYLPAFLTTCIMHQDEETNILSSIIIDLTPLRQITRVDKSFFLKKFGVFTAAQVRAIILFLEFSLSEINNSTPFNHNIKASLSFWRAHSSINTTIK